MKDKTVHQVNAEDLENAGSNIRSVDYEAVGVTDDELFALFVGPKAEEFKKINIFVIVVVLFLSIVWFFYRKMYLIGACVILFPILLEFLSPQLSDATNSTYGLMVAIVARNMYLGHVKRKMEQLKQLGLTPSELRLRVSKAGGTSLAGGLLGTLILLAVFWVVVSSAPTI